MLGISYPLKCFVSLCLVLVWCSVRDKHPLKFTVPRRVNVTPASLRLVYFTIMTFSSSTSRLGRVDLYIWQLVFRTIIDFPKLYVTGYSYNDTVPLVF